MEKPNLGCRFRAHFGFTLIELVLVILLIGILSAVAIPNFIDFRTDARNSATKGALGALRSAIAIATAAIALKEDPTLGSFPKYPTSSEMWNNEFLAASPSSHSVLAGTNIIDPSVGYPQNPWTVSTASTAAFNSIFGCDLTSKGTLNATVTNEGWCYGGGTLGTIWANSALNNQVATENTF